MAARDIAEVSEALAAALSAQPGVARLDGGPFGTVASYLPGRSVVGVRLPPAPGAAVEIAVVAHAGTPLPGLAAELAALVRGVLGEVPVDVTVVDVVPGPGAVEVVPAMPGRDSAPRPVT